MIIAIELNAYLMAFFAIVGISYLVIKWQQFSSSRRKWKPILNDKLYPPQTPLEIDPSKRNKILKRPFDTDLVSRNQWDAIVIGSGISGLTTASFLGQAGMKVLVLEKHSTCGGNCHTFNDQGYEFNVGIHYVCEMDNLSSAVKILLDQVSDGQIQWTKLETDFDVVYMDAGTASQRRFNIASPRGEWQKQLLQDFPDEKESIYRFFNLVDKITTLETALSMAAVKILPIWLVRLCDWFGLLEFFSNFFYFNKNRSLDDIVKELTANDHLRQLFTYIWFIYTTHPSIGSFSFHATVLDVYKNGCCFPLGGPSEIPFRIASVIERTGGCVMMNANVTQLITENRRVKGVRVESRTDDSTSWVNIYAPIVISDAGVVNTMTKLVPENIARTLPLWPIVTNAKPAIGLLCVYVGMKGTAKELGLAAQNIFSFKTNFEKEINEWSHLSLEDFLNLDSYPLAMGSHSAKDPSWEKRHPGRSVMAIMTVAHYSWFKKWSNLEQDKRSVDDEVYESIKRTIGQKLINQVSILYPNIKNAVDYVYVSTPPNHEHYLSAHRGAGFGLDHNRQRFDPLELALLRPTQCGLDGLYLTGQDITCTGLVPTLCAGLFCANAVMGQQLQNAIKLFKLIKA